MQMQLVELKNGESYNGYLESCDNYMNINLRDVTLTSRVRRRPVGNGTGWKSAAGALHCLDGPAPSHRAL
jgi:small nuclear ribonucleoprotein (snRNP)-like protein